jgi:hypothetical protein
MPTLPIPRPRRGAYAVEFALCLPVWVVVMAASMDFGWLFYHQAILDAAVNAGCRQGSLVDPGQNDENIEYVEERTITRMLAVLHSFGFRDATSYTLDAFTTGEMPRRTLVCDVTLETAPLMGMFMDRYTLSSTQIARLEWQREAAP